MTSNGETIATLLRTARLIHAGNVHDSAATRAGQLRDSGPSDHLTVACVTAAAAALVRTHPDLHSVTLLIDTDGDIRWQVRGPSGPIRLGAVRWEVADWTAGITIDPPTMLASMCSTFERHDDGTIRAELNLPLLTLAIRV